ncbi:hypothetical protein CBM2615_A170028 [Cupriavidus taiwanensis]|uniref:Uncharacterized protein n=1 Tax=Cupriavidus taiwanensis TaxID=164546 RepID=A0A976AUD0_9BURK|nr:hypothetical protein CBM2615_A170028 [Cupriavidus taiwanensis]SOZ52268.1 hypothetical protein CBM2614_A160028 [Cupriavidus taiwanensis]SOZ54807.1 hypothetical protein CBM2613_A180028 [Cupriavidus taiwanensis]SPA04388.1 hypothetical protein CBM2625_A130028 [Cupriavidus taiwanensis]
MLPDQRNTGTRLTLAPRAKGPWLVLPASVIPLSLAPRTIALVRPYRPFGWPRRLSCGAPHQRLSLTPVFLRLE